MQTDRVWHSQGDEPYPAPAHEPDEPIPPEEEIEEAAGKEEAAGGQRRTVAQ
jgi:hypothetical protein